VTSAQPAGRSLTVGIFLFDYVEVLDFAGPYEVLTTASRVFRRSAPAAPDPFSVCTIAATNSPVRARAGLLVTPDFSLEEHPLLDVLIVPGGEVTAELANASVVQWIAGVARRTTLTASVCTGAFLLAKAGLLDNRVVTTHWEDLADLQAMFPALTVRSGVRWVDEGAVVSSAGISAGIDMSLHLVERLAGRDLALTTARQMDFDWTENG
jgi:transcriptional regulator GlxA family with amidase domain